MNKVIKGGIVFSFFLLFAGLSIGSVQLGDGTVGIGVILNNLTGGSGSGSVNNSKEGAGPYLYNDSVFIYFNESKLNETIDDRAVGGGGNASVDDVWLNETGDTLTGTIVFEGDAELADDKSQVFFENGNVVVRLGER